MYYNPSFSKQHLTQSEKYELSFWRTPVLSVLHLLQGALLVSLLPGLKLGQPSILALSTKLVGCAEDGFALQCQGEEEQGRVPQLVGLQD